MLPIAPPPPPAVFTLLEVTLKVGLKVKLPPAKLPKPPPPPKPPGLPEPLGPLGAEPLPYPSGYLCTFENAEDGLFNS